MDQLFDTGETQHRTPVPPGEEPLAARIRPTSLDDFTGQAHLLGEGSALRTAIEQGTPHSMILYGPPGTGKTTLARIAATQAGGAFEEMSAVSAGRAEVRTVIERAEHRCLNDGQSTILFLDEIHRFNKAQQDTLLPAVEEGLLTLIGATTENPYFEVNSALLSRTQVYELLPLSGKQVGELLRRSLTDVERGIANPPEIAEDAIDFLAARSGGDARCAYNALELACETAQRLSRSVTVDLAEDSLQQKAVLYDKGKDKHYDYISAWIKATRGSDVDASLYYLAVMLEGGEDARFIARRMIILASEDIGNADPHALPLAVAAAQAVEHVGLPEAQLNLAQAAAYLALAPKSNASYLAIGRARGAIRDDGAFEPPPYLRDAHYPGAKQLGRGEGYLYAHDAPDGVSDQPLMPDEIRDKRFYEPVDRGFERELRKRLDWLENNRGQRQ